MRKRHGGLGGETLHALGLLVATIFLVTTLVAAVEAGGPPLIIKSINPGHGPLEGGTTVTISGNRFKDSDPVTSVTFGGVAANFTVDTDQQITAVSPPGVSAGQVTLTLTNSEDSKSVTFTYDAPSPTPTPTPTPDPTPSPTPDPSPTATTSTTSTPASSSPPSSAPVTTTSSEPAATPQPQPQPQSGGTGGGAAPVTVTITTTAEANDNKSTAGNAAAALSTPDVASDCWVSITPSAPGERIVVPFPAACSLASVVVQLPVADGPLNLSIRELLAWPEGVPVPDWNTPPVLVFDAELRDESGTLIQPASALLQVRVPGRWLQDCLPDVCRPELFHYHAGAWTQHPLRQVDGDNETAVLEAEAVGFSIFAIAGAKIDASNAQLPRLWALFGLLVVGLAAAGTTVIVRRKNIARSPPDKVSVDRLLQEMKHREELLQFVNNAAHDLANPLTPILMQLDMLSRAAEQTEDPKQKRSLAIVERNVEQLGRLIGDLRDASKLQAGKLKIFPETLELGELVRGSVDGYQPVAGTANVTLAFETVDGLNVDADGGRLTQVLTNFLNNALKFTAGGGRVEVRASRDGTHARVVVKDSGLGLSPEDQERLFKPFSQVHGATEKKKGTGLGLYIAKGIIEAHHGRIGCESDGPGTGSSFWFSIPLSTGEPKPRHDEDPSQNDG